MCAAAAGQNAQRGFRQRKARGVRRINKIAGQRQFAAAAEGRAIDCGNHRRGAVHDGVVGFFKDGVLHAPLFICHAVAFFQITAGAKRFVAGTGDQHAAHVLRMKRQRRKNLAQLDAHLCVERIACFGPIERDLQQAVSGFLGVQGLSGHIKILLKTITYDTGYSMRAPEDAITLA